MKILDRRFAASSTPAGLHLVNVAWIIGLSSSGGWAHSKQTRAGIHLALVLPLLGRIRELNQVFKPLAICATLFA